VNIAAYNACVPPVDRDAVVSALRAFFVNPPAGTAAVYLFGSVARAESAPGSDADVAILFDESPPRTLQGLHLGLADELQRTLGRRVDLIILNHAPADLVHRVLRDGILVCEPSRSGRIRFEVRLRNEYFDLEPIRTLYRRTAARGAATR
jgi:predicted nucleotidyltransferase